MKDEITGQLFVREQGKFRNGRRIFMVCGVLAVPEGVEIPSEHQLTFIGVAAPELGGIKASILTEPGFVVDRKEEARGLTADCLLTAPIWRV